MAATLRPAFRPKAPPRACPIHTSLDVLGRKWSLEILRDVTFYREVRFSDFLRLSEGLTPRVLTRRLKELERSGFIVRTAKPGSRREVVYDLTAKGRDVVPVLAAFIDFGIRHHADVVFEDGRPRSLPSFMPEAGCEILGRFRDHARVYDSRPRLTARSNADPSRRNA